LPRPAGRATFAGLASLPGYRLLAIGSLLWHLNRWGSLFATTLLLTDDGASPLEIQLVGALFFAPFLLGALAAAVFRTIGNPRSIVLGMQFAWYRSSC
jgi:hypothetical protein